MIQTISGAILTGGLSRRMGTDKALLQIGGKPMALVIARILQRATGSEPFLVAKCPRKYEHLGLPVVRDAMPHRSALAGIHAALRHAKTSRVLITTCDQPFLSVPLLREMVRSPGDVVACEVDRRLASFPVIFSTDLLRAIADSKPSSPKNGPKKGPIFFGWGGRIRTLDTQDQNLLPYHLATPQGELQA